MIMQAILIIAIFILSAILMMTKKLPALLALPLMAILIGFAAGLPAKAVMTEIVGAGTTRLASAMAAAIFGGMLAKVIEKTGISNGIVKRAAELAGDRPLVIALVLTAATAFIFTTLGGLGSVIMVGTIILPIMLSVGIKPLVSGSLMLLGLNLGGLFNLINYAFYSDTLKVPIEEIKSFSLTFGILMAIITLVFILVNVSGNKTTTTWSMPNVQTVKNNNDVPVYALITPLVPILLVFTLKMEIVTAMIIGSIFAILVTKPKEIINILSSSFVEGIKDVAAALAIMIGIGMVLLAVMHKTTAGIMQPLISQVLPSSPVAYVVFFAILSPLALYRGPLNMWGLGSGIAALMLASKSLSPVAIMAALLAVGNIQGACDPTNTHNVWVGNFVGEDTVNLLKKMFPYVFAFVVVALIYTAIFKF